MPENENQKNIFSETAGSFRKSATGPTWKIPFETFKLAQEYRKQIDEHKNAPWIIIILVSIWIDFFDFIFIGYFFKPFLFFALWGKGSWKAKVFIRFLLFFELIPGVNWLPLQTLASVYAWKHTSQRSAEAEKKLEELKSLDN